MLPAVHEISYGPFTKTTYTLTAERLQVVTRGGVGGASADIPVPAITGFYALTRKAAIRGPRSAVARAGQEITHAGGEPRRAREARERGALPVQLDAERGRVGGDVEDHRLAGDRAGPLGVAEDHAAGASRRGAGRGSGCTARRIRARSSSWRSRGRSASGTQRAERASRPSAAGAPPARHE